MTARSPAVAALTISCRLVDGLEATVDCLATLLAPWKALPSPWSARDFSHFSDQSRIDSPLSHLPVAFSLFTFEWYSAYICLSPACFSCDRWDWDSFFGERYCLICSRFVDSCWANVPQCYFHSSFIHHIFALVWNCIGLCISNLFSAYSSFSCHQYQSVGSASEFKELLANDDVDDTFKSSCVLAVVPLSGQDFDVTYGSFLPTHVNYACKTLIILFLF